MCRGHRNRLRISRAGRFAERRSCASDLRPTSTTKLPATSAKTDLRRKTRGQPFRWFHESAFVEGTKVSRDAGRDPCRGRNETKGLNSGRGFGKFGPGRGHYVDMSPSRPIHCQTRTGERYDMPKSKRANKGKAKITNKDSGDEARATRLAELYLAPGTRDTYGRALRRFDEWVDGRTVTDELVAFYLAVLFDRGLAPASAATVVAAIKNRAKREGKASPVGPCTQIALAAFRHVGAGRGPGQVDGISWQEAYRMADIARSGGRLRDLRDALLIHVMSDGLLRVSEAAALNVADIAFTEKGALVTIRRSKTDQEGKGATVVAGPETARLAREWIKEAGIDDGPLFRPVNKANRVQERPLSTRSLTDIVKKRAAAAGIEGRVSSHSLRVGSAQSLRERGATMAQLMDAGRWTRTDTVAHYTRAQDAEFGTVAQLRFGVVPPDAGGWEQHAARRRGKRAKAELAKEKKRLRRARKQLEKTLARIEVVVIGS